MEEHWRGRWIGLQLEGLKEFYVMLWKCILPFSKSIAKLRAQRKTATWLMLRPRTFPPRTFLYSVWRNLTKKSLPSRDTWAWKASRWFILLSGAFAFCFHPFVLCRLQKACPASLGSASSCPRPEIQMKAPLINGGCLPVFGLSLPSYAKWFLLWQGISPTAGRALFNPCALIGTEPIIVLRREEFRCFAFDCNDWVCLGRSFQKKLAC